MIMDVTEFSNYFPLEHLALLDWKSLETIQDRVDSQFMLIFRSPLERDKELEQDIDDVQPESFQHSVAY